MAKYIATDTDLTSVANAIRTKGGISSQLEFPTGFVSAIGALGIAVSDDGNGNVTLTNVIASGDGDGNVTLS